MLKTDSTTSVLPAPTKPVKPMISPAWTLKETSSKKPLREKCSTLNLSSPGSMIGFGNKSVISRPTMALMRSLVEIPSTS